MASIAVCLPSASLLLKFGLQALLFLCTPCQVSALIGGRRQSPTPADLNEVHLQCCPRNSDTSVEFLKRLDVRSNQPWGWHAQHETTLSSVGDGINPQKSRQEAHPLLISVRFHPRLVVGNPRPPVCLAECRAGRLQLAVSRIQLPACSRTVSLLQRRAHQIDLHLRHDCRVERTVGAARVIFADPRIVARRSLGGVRVNRAD
jgi:hypothetical protein